MVIFYKKWKKDNEIQSTKNVPLRNREAKHRIGIYLFYLGKQFIELLEKSRMFVLGQFLMCAYLTGYLIKYELMLDYIFSCDMLMHQNITGIIIIVESYWVIRR